MSFANVDLDIVKSFLGYTDTSRDIQLNVMIEAGIGVLKSVTGRNLEYGLYKESWQVRADKHLLTEYPAEFIVEVADGSSIVDPSNYKLFRASGTVLFTGACGPRFLNGGFTRLAGNMFSITYAGGYSELPAELLLALLTGIQAADNLQKQAGVYGGPLKRLSVYDVGVTDFAVSKGDVNSVMKDSISASLQSYMDRAGTLGAHLVHEVEYLGVAPGSPI